MQDQLRDAILEFLFKSVVYLGGAAAVFALLGKKLVQSFIDSHFGKRMELFRHQQAKELQRLRAEVDSTLSGAIRIQEREFSALPKIWNRLLEANSMTLWVTERLQNYPDLANMNRQERDEHYSRAGMLASYRDRIDSIIENPPEDPTRAIAQVLNEDRLYRAEQSFRAFERCFLRHSIFLPEHIDKRASEARTLMRQALEARAGVVHDGTGDQGSRARAAQAAKEASVIVELLRDVVRHRLQSHGRPDGAAGESTPPL